MGNGIISETLQVVSIYNGGPPGVIFELYVVELQHHEKRLTSQ